jgi:hypothetical protein
MGVGDRLCLITTNRKYTFLFFMTVSIIPRLVVWALLPLDWNPDSYHHWQISYLTLKIGLRYGRMWDLNGCEYYWGILPHLVQAFSLWVFSTASILPYRVLNIMLGGVNTYLIYLIGRDNFHKEVGLYAGLLFALYPVAAIFDVIAMQETLALCFALISIYLFRSHPGWSGVFLALACQSRIEFWLVSIAFVLGVALVERLSTQIQSFLLCWLGVTGIFCLLFRHWTSNPIYPLYWSLFNVFGGWTQRGQDLPLLSLLLTWIVEKLLVWSRKATGLVLIGSFTTYCGVFLHMLRYRWKTYHLVLFFLNVLIIFSPLFVTYYPSHIASMLLMLRMSIPIAAFGSLLLIHTLFKAQRRLFGCLPSKLHLEKILIIITVASFSYFIPAYGQFQMDTQLAFTVANTAINYYEGGTIVCDHPTMNYWFAYRWHVRASRLLSNHYSPHYYDVTNPLEFARWFENNNITLWIYADSRAHPVWEVVNDEFPDLLVIKEEIHGIKVYRVDRTVLERVLSH